MKKNNIIIIFLVIVIIALITFIAAPFIINNQANVIVYNNTIADVGTFNSTNVTNFTLSNSTNNYLTDDVGNDSIAQISTTSSSSMIETTIDQADKVNDSAEGHTIYKNTANVGEYKGEIRYFSILQDNDNDRYVMISTADYNLTCMMVDTFKFY